MNRGAVLLLLVALGVAAVQAQSSAAAKTDFNAALTKNGFKLAAALFDIANLTTALNKPSAKYTVLVPNDAAVEAFLKKMGLTVDDLKKRPLLAKELAAQHIILGANVRPTELFADGTTRIVATAARKPNDLVFKKLADGSVKVTDIQGQTANVKKTFTIDENKTGHGVDKVLMPDTVFYSFQSLCQFRRLTLKDFCNAVNYAGLDATLNAAKVDATFFVPNNQAFANAVDLSGGVVPSAAKTADILKYHGVAGYHTLGHNLPTSFKDMVPDQTLLAGQTVTVDYSRVKPADGKRKLPYANATVLSTSGQKANVLKANVHVGTAVVHGVNMVLMPGNATAAATTKPAAAATTAKPAAAAAKPAGRRLLDFGWGAQAGSTAAGDDASSEIQSAADGDEAVAAAGDQSLLQDEALSVPGDYNQIDNGINPW